MLTVKIGTEERQFRDNTIDEGWISQQIDRQATGGRSPCVQVSVNSASGINIGLATVACRGSADGRHPVNTHERAILALWLKHGMDRPVFDGTALIGFLKSLKKYM